MSKIVDTIVIPVAGMGTRFLPVTKEVSKEMLPILNRPLIDYAIEEAKEAGIKKFIFITSEKNTALKKYFLKNNTLSNFLKSKNNLEALDIISHTSLPSSSISFITQKKSLGLGHAILCAKKLLYKKSFAVILPDDLILGENCLKQMIKYFNIKNASIIGSMKVKKEEVYKYGIIDPGAEEESLIRINNMIEKPLVSDAPSDLAVVGRYVLDYSVISYLESTLPGVGGEIQLTDAIVKSLENKEVYGYKFLGRRFDCGNVLGNLQAQVAVALSSKKIGKEALKIINNEIYLKENK